MADQHQAGPRRGADAPASTASTWALTVFAWNGRAPLSASYSATQNAN